MTVSHSLIRMGQEITSFSSLRWTFFWTQPPLEISTSLLYWLSLPKICNASCRLLWVHSFCTPGKKAQLLWLDVLEPTCNKGTWLSVRTNHRTKIWHSVCLNISDCTFKDYISGNDSNNDDKIRVYERFEGWTSTIHWTVV